MAKRVLYLDNAKGLGILLVILGHILPMHTNPVSVWLYSFHMSLFYIVTGTIHSRNVYSEYKPNIYIYIYKRAKNTLYPYITFSFLAIVFATVIGLLSNSWSRATHAVIDTLTLQGYSALWFLPAFLFSEALFFLVIRSQSKLYIIIKTTLLLFAVLLMSLFDFRDVLDVLSPIYYFIGRILVGSVFMLIGYFVNEICIPHNKRETNGMTLLIGVIFAIANVFTSQLNPEVDVRLFYLGNPLLFFMNGVLGSYGVILICKAVMDREIFLTFYGQNSMIILVTHLPLPVLLTICKAVELLKIPVDSFRYFLDFIICMFAEAVIVIVINRYFKFLFSIEELKRIQTRCSNGTDCS